MSKERIGMMVMIAAAVAVAAAVFSVTGGGTAREGTMLAQVGVAVGVAPNPYNTLNDQLNAKQAQLDMEAADLAAQRAALASDTASGGAVAGSASPYWYLVAAVGALTLLVILNFSMDLRRAERERAWEEEQERSRMIPPLA